MTATDRPFFLNISSESSADKSNMKILFIGDVVGKCGCNFLHRNLFNLKNKYNADLTIVNGENSATGNGITKESADIIFSSGADVITTGNHVFQKNEAFSLLDENDNILRPANFPEGTPGKGFCFIDFGHTSVAVVNLMGTLLMESLDNPFATIDRILNDIDTPNIFVDFHAEATSEKKAMGFHLASRVTALIGTHTHVQTADEAILRSHTAYLTDAGMTGAEDSVIGFEKDCALSRIKDHIPVRFKESESSPFICGVVIEFDEKLGKALSIERFIFR